MPCRQNAFANGKKRSREKKLNKTEQNSWREGVELFWAIICFRCCCCWSFFFSSCFSVCVLFFLFVSNWLSPIINYGHERNRKGKPTTSCCFVVVKIFAQIKLNGTFLTLYVVDVLRISMVFFFILSLNKATD